MCTGFVKSPFKIDTSTVKINLLTGKHFLKESTSIVPDNGFFAIPIYNEGEYILQISTVKNSIIFDPTEYKISISNVNNNGKKEYNFNVLGYQVKGIVEGVIDKTRIAIKLESFDGNYIKMESINDEGLFKFIVEPGKYYISILTSQSTCFHKSLYNVNVIDTSVTVPNTIIAGYSVDVDIEEINNNMEFIIKFEIISNNILSNENCLRINDNNTFKCVTEVIELLPHTIKCLPKGEYIIRPLIENNDGIVFEPKEKNITINNKNIDIIFKVKTFTAHGIIETNGTPIAGVKIFNDKEYIATTDGNGLYQWEGVKKGIYTIRGEKDGIIFTPTEVSLDVQQRRIKTLTVIKFRVSGHVTFENNITKKVDLTIESLVYRARLSIRTNEQGKFLIFLPVGNYSITVTDKSYGFVPGTHIVNFIDRPQDSVIFSKLKINIIINIKLIDNVCNNIDVHVKDNEGLYNKIRKCENNNQIIFKDFSPGFFTITIDNKNLYCWEKIMISKDITNDNDNMITFNQKGYYLKIYSPIDGRFELIEKSTGYKNELLLKTGTNLMCIPRKGKYKIINNDCYIIDEKTNELTINDFSEETLKVKEMLIRLGMEMVDVIVEEELQFSVKIVSDNIDNEMEKIYKSKIKSKNEHILEFYIDSQNFKDTFLVTPIFKDNIVEPKSAEVNFKQDCSIKKNTFKVWKGFFIEGSISPFINGSIVKYIDENNNIIIEDYVMDNGTFRIGPLKDINDNYLHIEKERYKFVPLLGSKNYQFKSVELSTLYVEFRDTKTGEYIEDIVASIAGESSYLTTNNVKTGILEITNLDAGKYIISPFRQEYRFNSKTNIITIETGKLTSLTIYGTQFSYSIYGLVTYPNGDPVIGIKVNALSSNCQNLQEEGITDRDGKYRVPNIHPECTYNLYIVTFKNNNYYSYPKDYNLKLQNQPIRNINFLYFQLAPHELEIYVKINLIDIPIQNYIQIGIYRTKTKALVYKKLLNKEQLSFFIPKIPLDNKSYFVKIDKISDSRLSYTSNKGTFVANNTFQLINLSISRKEFVVESGITLGNIVGLIFMSLIVLVFLNPEKSKFFLLITINFCKLLLKKEGNINLNEEKNNHKRR
uniref:Carboxypeptidase regulatory-like domain-containing protein n=1 Tax=Parastrongyloides trichosuri TaxID=131310 RepID=A0A0N4ZNW8_PARTI